MIEASFFIISDNNFSIKTFRCHPTTIISFPIMRYSYNESFVFFAKLKQLTNKFKSFQNKLFVIFFFSLFIFNPLNTHICIELNNHPPRHMKFQFCWINKFYWIDKFYQIIHAVHTHTLLLRKNKVSFITTWHGGGSNQIITTQKY